MDPATRRQLEAEGAVLPRRRGARVRFGTHRQRPIDAASAPAWHPLPSPAARDAAFRRWLKRRESS